MKRKVILDLIFIIILPFTIIATLLSQGAGTGTPDFLRVITDAKGYLLTTSQGSQTLPLSQPTQFLNTRLSTDANGYLLVAGGGTPQFTFVTSSPGTSTGNFGKVPIYLSYNQTYVDTATQNLYNVMEVDIPAGALANIGDTLRVRFDGKHAANGNAVEYQMTIGGTACGGSGASCCTGGVKYVDNSTSSTGVGIISDDLVIKTSNNNQNITGVTWASTTPQSQESTSSTSTDTLMIPIDMCVRNTAASAASLQGIPTLRVEYWGR